MYWLRKRKDKNRPPNSGESQTVEGEHAWIKVALENASAIREEQQIQEEDGRQYRPQIKENTMTTAQEVLALATRTYADRSQEYGAIRTSFTRIATISSTVLDKTITPHDIAIVMIALKQARITSNPQHLDSYVDLAVYSAIAAELATTPKMPQVGEPFLATVEAALHAAD
jgi:translation initiation factor 2 alpha subunit (eIF-2alpha)